MNIYHVEFMMSVLGTLHATDSPKIGLRPESLSQNNFSEIR